MKHTFPRKVTPQLYANIKKSLKRGKTHEHISNVTGLSRKTISAIRKSTSLKNYFEILRQTRKKFAWDRKIGVYTRIINRLYKNTTLRFGREYTPQEIKTKLRYYSLGEIVDGLYDLEYAGLAIFNENGTVSFSLPSLDDLIEAEVLRLVEGKDFISEYSMNSRFLERQDPHKVIATLKKLGFQYDNETRSWYKK